MAFSFSHGFFLNKLIKNSLNLTKITTHPKNTIFKVMLAEAKYYIIVITFKQISSTSIMEVNRSPSPLQKEDWKSDCGQIMCA